MRQHWNAADKAKIQSLLQVKLKKELAEKEFLDDKKFDIMDDEVRKALRDLALL
jgi:hypothetical protein